MNGMPSVPDFIAKTDLTNIGISLGGAALINGIFGRQWGIFNQFGIPIMLADSVVSFSYDANADISKYPVEGGKFASYNKVSNPSMYTVQFAKQSGGVLERGAFLAQIEAALKSTLNFNIVTPEYVYLNSQVIGINLDRSREDGATCLRVNVELEEVREAKVEYAFEEVKAPSDSNTVDGGAKESSEASTSVLQRVFG